MSKTATQLLQTFLKSGVAPPLKAAGFTAQGRVWRREVGDVLQIIDIQLWKYNDALSARFTVELGVCFPQLLAAVAALNQFAYFRPQLAKPSITECIERTRIGMLLDDAHDHWWSVTASPSNLPDADEIIAPLMSRGLPWLQRYSSLEETWHAGTQGDGALRIAACAQLGLRDEALAAATRLAERLSFGNADNAASVRHDLTAMINKLAPTASANRN